MTAIYLAEIIICIALVGVILIQSRGAGGLGGIFGGAQSSGGYRTRRGIEQTLLRATIVLAVVFVVISAIGAALE